MYTVKAKSATKKHQLTTEEKQNNSVISGIRAVVEHAISGMKRLACMSHVYRNRNVSVDDSFALLSARM
jgi:DDE superfamily endonuclease